MGNITWASSEYANIYTFTLSLESILFVKPSAGVFLFGDESGVLFGDLSEVQYA